MAKTAAQRQKEYRDNKRNAPVTEKSQNVTAPAGKVTRSPENVTEPGPNVTDNPVSGEIPRKNGNSTPVTPTPDSGSESRIASIEDYHAHREDYAERACAALLNWGPWMNASELKEARLSGNRVTLLGDWDYVPAATASKESCYF